SYLPCSHLLERVDQPFLPMIRIPINPLTAMLAKDEREAFSWSEAAHITMLKRLSSLSVQREKLPGIVKNARNSRCQRYRDAQRVWKDAIVDSPKFIE